MGRGDFFSSDGQIPVFTKNIQNDTGTAIVNFNRLPQTPGVSGSGVMVSLTFQSVNAGTTTVTVPNMTVRNAQGQPVFTREPADHHNGKIRKRMRRKNQRGLTLVELIVACTIMLVLTDMATPLARIQSARGA